MSASPVSYRDKIHILKDIILKLNEYYELNQTALISFCGLNLKKHKSILDEMESKNLIRRDEKQVGKKKISTYRLTTEGAEFCTNILEPYEKMFPRKKMSNEKSHSQSEQAIDHEIKHIN